MAAPAESRTPNLHRANESLLASANGSMASAATRRDNVSGNRHKPLDSHPPSHGRRFHQLPQRTMSTPQPHQVGRLCDSRLRASSPMLAIAFTNGNVVRGSFSQGVSMKDIHEVLRQKESDLVRVSHEVDSLQLVATLLSDEALSTEPTEEQATSEENTSEKGQNLQATGTDGLFSSVNAGS